LTPALEKAIVRHVNRIVAAAAAAVSFVTVTFAGATARADEDRLGRFTVGARFGGGASVFAQSSTFDTAGRPLFDTSLVLTVALSPGRRVRLVFAPGLVYSTQSYVDPLDPTMSGSRDIFIVSLPLGLEYDIPVPLRRAPGLFLYAQGLIGYAANVVVLSGGVAFSGGDTSATLHQGVAEGVFGLRYAFRNRVELVFEPVSVPVYFSRGSALLLYRARAGIGFRF
jgi:hypothetical protein